MADPLEALRQQPAQGQKVADDNFEAYRRPLLFNSVNCADCHPKKKDSDFRLSLSGFVDNPYKGLDALKKGLPGEDAELAALFKPLTPEQQKAVAKREAERFEKEDPIEKTIHVLSRMPGNFALQFTDKKLSVQTDFARLVESVPTVTLDDNSRKILGGVKQLSLEGNTFTMDLTQKQSLPINRDIPLLGKVKELGIGDGKQQVRFDVDFDKNAQRVAVKHIEGIAINLDCGKSLSIHELSLDTSGKTPMLMVNIDNPKECPIKGGYLEKNWPKTITVPLPLDSVLPGMDANFVKGLVKTLADAKTALENKDASMFLSGIGDDGIRGKLQGMLKGITSITKKGDTFEITRNNGVITQDFNGPDVRVSPRVTFTVGRDVDAPSIRNIQGIDFSAPLPSQLGLGDRFTIGLKGIELGPKTADGRRLTVSTDNVLDKVTVSLDKDMKPKTDGDGNWAAGITVKNPLAAEGRYNRLSFNLPFDKNGQPNMPASDVLEIARRATAQGVDFSISGAGMAILSDAAGTASDVARVVEWIKGWFD